LPFNPCKKRKEKLITLKLACNKLKHGFPSLEVDCNTRIETINPLEDQFKPKKNYSQPIGQLNMEIPLQILIKISIA